MSTIAERLSAIGIMPVIAKLESEADCAALADALTRGGIPQMEITFRMEGAENYIRYARSYAPDMIVGAGTVTTIEQAQKAIDAGAQFIVAPGLNPQIVKFCQQAGIAVCPGVATASEVEQALGLGLKLVKFFPAEQAERRHCSHPRHLRAVQGHSVHADRRPESGQHRRLFCL